MHDYDLIVIGSGPAGRRAAIQAAKLGRSVLVIDRGRRVGGVSVHTGTIPSKTLRETVLNLTGLARARLLRPAPIGSRRTWAPRTSWRGCA
ncbi:MAG: FAD-dependent oxidoreductase [Caulobacteraceae bacterium]